MNATGSNGDHGKRYALVAVLNLVGSILLLIGWLLVISPSGSRWDSLWGLLVGTIGIAMWRCIDKVASVLGKAREIARHFMQLAILFCPLLALGGGHSGGGGQIKGGWPSTIFGGMLGIESLVWLIWLSLKRPSPLQENP